MCAFLIPRVSGEDLSVGNIQVRVFRCLLLAESCHSSWQLRPTLIPSTVAVYPPAEDKRLALHLNMIQRLIHRQFTQHHQLRNPDRSLAMGRLQHGSKVVEHFTGRAQ